MLPPVDMAGCRGRKNAGVTAPREAGCQAPSRRRLGSVASSAFPVALAVGDDAGQLPSVPFVVSASKRLVEQGCVVGRTTHSASPVGLGVRCPRDSPRTFALGQGRAGFQHGESEQVWSCDAGEFLCLSDGAIAGCSRPCQRVELGEELG